MLIFSLSSSSYLISWQQWISLTSSFACLHFHCILLMTFCLFLFDLCFKLLFITNTWGGRRFWMFEPVLGSLLTLYFLLSYPFPKMQLSSKFSFDFFQIYIYIYVYICISVGFHGSLAGKESTCNAGDPGSIPG